jgi:tetratricopeptide (TPR) repeat protein
MRLTRLTPILALVAALVVPARIASADGRGSAPAPPPSSQPPLPTDRPMTPEEKAAMEKARAGEIYDSAYREITKAQGELAEAATLAKSAEAKDQKKAEDKKKSAQKRLVKSAEKLGDVVKLDPKNANAWNMLGYSRRMTGDVKSAFDAYWECLRLNPEHAGAHEYLGEAYLMSGRVAEAQAELAWLEKKGAKAEAGVLAASVAAYLEKNPGAATGAAQAAQTSSATTEVQGTIAPASPAPADSTAKP